MLVRFAVFLVIFFISLTLPWYVSLLALVVAVIIYDRPYEFIGLGLVVDLIYGPHLERYHEFLITIGLLVVYSIAMVLQDRLRLHEL